MVKKLIINADDFGVTEGVTKGVIDSYADGVLTSATLLVNMPFTEFALEEAKKHPGLGVGIHLAATIGRPLVAGAKSFTDSEGDFLKLSDYPGYNVDVDPEELYKEWKAQMEQFIRLAGKLPTHIDSHHHVHTLHGYHDMVAQLAKEYDLPVRQSEKFLDTYEHATFMGDFYGEDLAISTLTDALETDIEIMEVMCHPAYLDQKTYEISSYHLPRMKEMEILRSKELRSFIQQNGIELITFADLKKKSV